MEVILSMIIVELKDGSFRADCPEFGFSVTGKSEAEASANLKAEAKRRAKEAKDSLTINKVKCMKFKVTA